MDQAQVDEVTPYTGHKYLLFLGNDDDRFMLLCDLMHALPDTSSVFALKVNCDPDSNRRRAAVARVKTLKLYHVIILLTGVPDDDIELLKRDALGIIDKDSYYLRFVKSGIQSDIRDTQECVSQVVKHEHV